MATILGEIAEFLRDSKKTKSNKTTIIIIVIVIIMFLQQPVHRMKPYEIKDSKM